MQPITPNSGESWQFQFRRWIKRTQENIDLWQSNKPEIVVARIMLRDNGIDVQKVLIEKWQAQIKAWQADLTEFETIEEIRNKEQL